MFFACVMLIVMGVCKLNENTQIEIHKRALKETQKDTLLFIETEEETEEEEEMTDGEK